jgi:hypothetical protein
LRLPETTISLTGKEKTFTNTSEEPESHPDQSTTQGAETPTVLTRIIESGIPPLATIRLFSTSAPIVDVSVQLCSTNAYNPGSPISRATSSIKGIV